MKRKAFTLLEILLVIAAIGILAAIVIVAINPQRQLSQIRDSERTANLNALHSALDQYLIDEGEYPVGLTSQYQDVCDTGSNGVEEGSIESDCVDLRVLVPRYLAAIPNDRQTDTHTGYRAAIHPTNNNASLIAVASEITPNAINPIQVDAVGGIVTDIEHNGSMYRVHSFPNTGEYTFTIDAPGEVDVLVVGGGGSGGGRRGGGGGAGEVLEQQAVFLETGTQNIVVGAGGARKGRILNLDESGDNGGSSFFGDIEAIGGGGGGNRRTNGLDGGSGGGAGAEDYIGGGAVGSGLGFGGGDSFDARAGAGGGGAGAQGGDATGTGDRDAGDGGVGIDVSHFGTHIGLNGRLGGGGGGGEYNTDSGYPNATAGVGVDGGGVGQHENPIDSGCDVKHDGLDGTGGGGGGASGDGSHACGGAGGAGVVVVRYALYSTPSLSGSAQGGLVEALSAGGDDYLLHRFVESGTFEVLNDDVEVEYLIVAGGGGAGSDNAGGGGGGGVLSGTMMLSPGEYQIEVGQGGRDSGTGNADLQASGENSSAFELVAIGGGFGANGQSGARPPASGGSGGGGEGETSSSSLTLGAGGTPGQGFAGGNGGTSDHGGGGGGGAAEPGGDFDGTLGGSGGDGFLSAITGTSLMYGSGGGGGAENSIGGGSAGSFAGGGAGGGTSGGQPGNQGESAAPNTGGGGGGSSRTSSAGGSGGSGVVLIRYQL